MRNPTTTKTSLTQLLLVVLALALSACSKEPADPEAVSVAQKKPASVQPSVLLITLDTTRADSLGIESNQVETPNLDALAARGVYFDQAYSVTPTTLPSHTSMLTGLYPADHHIRENGRQVSKDLELLPALLKAQGYVTAAFVSSFPLASQFGLSRGFDLYDDDFGSNAADRSATDTTDLATAWVQAQVSPVSATGKSASQNSTTPTFMWVHYFDPHEPYLPPEPFRSQYPNHPYLGEIAYMDQQLGRLVAAFEQRFQGQPTKIIVVGDHGEGLGDHGEALHGNLLYQSTMRVPLIIAGTNIEPGTTKQAVSVRQVFDTVLDWAGLSRAGQSQSGSRGSGTGGSVENSSGASGSVENPAGSLLGEQTEPVLGEALKPYMQYGWQPQFMAVQDGIKVISSGDIEIYDVFVDPSETNNLDGQVEPDPAVWDAIEAYTARALDSQPQGEQTLSQEALDKLASLGYIGSSSSSNLRDDAPSPKDMVYLFHDLDVGAGYFIREDYAAAIPVFSRVFEADPHNFMVALRLAVAYSVTDNEAKAQEYFDRARTINASSVDLRHYQAMHYLKNEQWDLARPLFESVLAQTPNRLPAMAGLSQVYTRQGELELAISQLERIVRIKDSAGLEWARIGQLRMSLHDTNGAIRAFEAAQKILGDQFTFHLEMGMLYMAASRFNEAASSLDSVSKQHPAYPVALYKRAQVSVLLRESDREQRVRQAWAQADSSTRALIEAEPMFKDMQFR